MFKMRPFYFEIFLRIWFIFDILCMLHLLDMHFL